jgi:hypothetical protein
MGSWGEVIKLGLQINADSSQAEAAVEHLRASTVAGCSNISSAWSGVMSAITGPTGIALGALTAFGGGMLEAANKAAEMGGKIYEAHEKTGLASASLSGLMAVSKETGGNFEGLTIALGRAGVNLEKTRESGGQTNELLFAMMGGAKGLAELGLKPMDEQLQVVLHRIFGLSNEQQRNTALSELLGRGWQSNFAVLKLLAEQGYGPAIEQAKKLHVFFDDKAAQQAFQYTIQMRQLKAEISGLALVVGQELVPKITEWLAQLHTIPYEIQLLKIGIEAQALSMLNIGGIFNKQLDALAAKATDVFTAEHLALIKYKQDIDGLAAGSEHADEPMLKLAKAAKELKDHFRELRPEIPALVEAIYRFRESLAAEEVHREVEAFFGFDEASKRAALSVGTLADGVTRLPPLFAQWTNIMAAQLPPFQAQLATERELAIIHKQLTTLFPQLTKEQVDAKTAELARNPALLQLIVHTAELTKGTKLYRQEMAELVKMIRESVEGEDALINKERERLATQQELNQSMKQMADATLTAGIAAAIYGENVSKALEKAAKSAIASIAEQAGVQALNALAQGLWLLAQSIWTMDPAMAAAATVDFEAAAEWGAIAGVAGAASAAIPSGARGAGAGAGAAGRYEAGSYSGGYGRGGGVDTGAYGMAPGAAPMGGPPSGQLTVMVVGDAQAGEWLASTLNRSVQRGVPLNATTVQKSPYAAG